MAGQQHLDRLSAVDAAFLAQEGPTTHMHIGGVAIFEGPPPAYEEFRAHIESRLHLVPRYRQKLAFPPLDTGRPLWVDDPTFNLGYHVRHTALPGGGGEAALLRQVGRAFSQRLDRSKPLWELYLVEGLDGDRFAFVSKTHHALVDGVSGVDLATVLFDLGPEGRALDPQEPWVPHPEPSGATLAARGVEGAARRVTDLASSTVGAATRPGETLGRAREVAAALSEVARVGLDAAPRTPLDVTPGPHRRVAFVRARLDDFKTIKDALGGTVNDVVLTVVTGALRDFMRSRGRRTDAMELKACVPVSVRGPDSDRSLGNQLTQVMAPLPLFLDDPVARLRYVREAMGDIKDSRLAMGANAIAALQDFAPPTLLSQASRMNFAGRFYNLLVTNIPGPQFPLYVLGRRLEAMFPVAFLAGNRTLAVAIISYDGALNFGLIADYDELADLDVVAAGIESSTEELLGLARRHARTESRKAKRRSTRRAAGTSGG
jgi:diacylglycerol O-acyltransferase / wax synthase